MSSDLCDAQTIERALDLLEKARSLVKSAEAFYDNNFPVPALNEFRNVAYHLAEYVRNPLDKTALESVWRHTKKAYLDANEAYAQVLLECVIRYNEMFAGYNEIVRANLPKYGEQKKAFLRLQNALRDYDVNAEAQRFERAQALEADFAIVRNYLEDIETYNDSICDAIRKSKQQTCQWVLSTIIAIVAALIGYCLTLFT